MGKHKSLGPRNALPLIVFAHIEILVCKEIYPPETPTRPKTSTYKNQIPVILSNIDKKFQTWRQVMGELRQHHPNLRISKVKALQKGDLLVVGDSPQDAVILQSRIENEGCSRQKR